MKKADNHVGIISPKECLQISIMFESYEFESCQKAKNGVWYLRKNHVLF